MSHLSFGGQTTLSQGSLRLSENTDSYIMIHYGSKVKVMKEQRNNFVVGGGSPQHEGVYKRSQHWEG